MLARLTILIAAILALIASPAAAGDWHRADTHSFTIYSDGSRKQLEDFAVEVERFDALLRMLFKKPVPAEVNRLTIYLLDDSDDVARLIDSDNVAGFWTPRVNGTFAVANRERGGRGSLDGKRVLFHEYAHHFMFRNLPIPAPAWFVEGFAEFVATAEFEKNGRWSFGEPAHHRADEVRYFANPRIRNLLAGPSNGSDSVDGFYGWAWALTHMLYSAEHDRGDKIDGYLRAINRGDEPMEAAEAAFGDLDQLGRELRAYPRRSFWYTRTDLDLGAHEDVAIARLSEIEGDVLELAIRRRGGRDVEDVRDDLLRLTREGGESAEAFYQLGEAEMTLAHRAEAGEARHDFGAAHAAVDRALAIDPDHVGARVLKGRLLLEPFDHADDPDPANWAAARKHFVAANNVDPTAAAPLFYFAQTFQREGVDDPNLNAALGSAFDYAPEVAEVRLAYAFDLARLGKHDDGIRLLSILANNPHGGSGARSAITAIETMRDTGVTGFTVFREEDDEDAGAAGLNDDEEDEAA